MNTNRWKLSEIENQEVFEKVIKPIIENVGTKQENPIALFLGGQPGAGKSALAEEVLSEFESKGSLVPISTDDYRDKHPHQKKLMETNDKIASQLTGPDCGLWVQKAVALAKENKFNILLDGTLRDSEAVAQSMTSLRKAGYKIEVRIVAVSAQQSQLATMLRYEGQKADKGVGRMTSPEAHDAGYHGLPVTLKRIEDEMLADKIGIYQRGGDKLYENSQDQGQWKYPPKAVEVLEDKRNRRLSPTEAEAYLKDCVTLNNLVNAPNRNATIEERRMSGALVESAKIQLNEASSEQYFNNLIGQKSETASFPISHTLSNDGPKLR